MWFFIVRRVLYAVPILLGVSMVVFVLMKMVPGDAADIMIPPEAPKEVAKTEPKETKPEPKVDATPAVAKGTGTLLLGSKPPCDIYIDGKDSGLQTPQRDIKLSAGKHKITLVNNEYGIKETFSVEIKPDTVEKQIKDYSDRIPK